MDHLTIRHLEDPAAFALQGELDLASAEELWARVQAVAPEGELTVDLSGLTFMDSSGLRVFLRAAAARTNGSCVVLRTHAPQSRTY